ncbi:hypothetical protein B0H16DRAFT_1466777 [Mycena metata]|uniref:Bacteriophage T5 Orf172 DNA-binding domain-containing protein n=1 Tax=Mycena metata TaxID=1033252 RepID=A0AAD7I0Q1_9AGAR|nr:hypothetical protein B0H16DRAFT_1468551 [Mycena metata]KAJ7736324.1 hypothetical protein B0H16DRAFT_1466777 [Mycena metata]
MLDLPRVSITRRDFQSAQRLQPAFYYALCTPWGSARRRGPSFPQNVWPAFDPLRESTSVLTALDPLFFNCEILSVLIQRLPAFTFNPQVPGTSPPAAQNSRGRCSTSLSCFCRNESSFLFNEYSPTRVIWPGNHQSPASAHAEQREKLPVPPIALTRPRVADRSELRATPDPPRVSITRRAIQAAQRFQTSFPAISGPPVLLYATAVPRFSELIRVLSQPLQTPVRGVLHPSRPFVETNFIILKIKFKLTRQCGPRNCKQASYPLSSPLTQRPAFLGIAHQNRPHRPASRPAAPALRPDLAPLNVLDTEVPECKPLVHLDAAPDSLDLSLDALPPPTPATCTLPTHPYHLRIRGPHPTFAVCGCAARSLRPLLTSNHHHRPESVNPSGAAQRGDIQHQHPPRPIKVRSRGPSPPTSLNLQPPPPPPSRIGQSVGSGAATPTTSSTTTTNNVAGVTTSAMLALVVVTVTAPLVAALVVVALVDYLFFAPPFSTLQWCEYYGAACGLRALYLFTPPSLRQINDLNPLARIAALAGFPSRFAREGPGFVYVLGLVDDWNLGDWHAHRIGDSQFLDHFRLKIGVTVDVHKRQLRYQKCDVFQSHFWVWSFRVRNHMVAERLCHILLDIEDNNVRAAFQCPAPRCDTRHQEFWWLRRHGGFLNVHERVRAALALLGEREERASSSMSSGPES